MERFPEFRYPGHSNIGKLHSSAVLTTLDEEAKAAGESTSTITCLTTERPNKIKVSASTSYQEPAVQFLSPKLAVSRRRSIFSMVLSPTNSSPSPSPFSPTVFFDETFHINCNGTEGYLDLFGYEDAPNCQAEAWMKMFEMDAETFTGVWQIERLLDSGVPKKLRGQAWKWLVKRQLSQKQFAVEVPVVSEERYEELKSQPFYLPTIEHVITADVPRTLTKLPYFCANNELSKSRQQSLLNILKSYSLIDTEVGYCQGMNFVAGILLIHSKSEFEAFSLFLSFMYGLGSRNIYLPNLQGLKRSLYKLTRLLDSDFTEILEHLIINNFPSDLATSSWFLTTFSSQFPIQFAARIFDLVFYAGNDMIMNTVYMIFALNKQALLKTKDFEGILHFFTEQLLSDFPKQFDESFLDIISISIGEKLYRYEIEFDIFDEEENKSAIESAGDRTGTTSSLPMINENNTNISLPSVGEGNAESLPLSGAQSWLAQDLACELVKSRITCAELKEQIGELQLLLRAKDEEIRALICQNTKLLQDVNALKSQKQK